MSQKLFCPLRSPYSKQFSYKKRMGLYTKSGLDPALIIKAQSSVQGLRTVKSQKYKRLVVVFKIKDLNRKQMKEPSHLLLPLYYVKQTKSIQFQIHNSRLFLPLPKDGSVIYFRHKNLILKTSACRSYDCTVL